MSAMSVTSPAAAAWTRSTGPASAPAVSAVPAKFVDMYRGAITSAIDTDGDGKISEAEYERQLVGAGSSADDAKKKWQALETGGDGTIADDAFAKTIADPLGNERDAVLRQIIKELSAGQSANRPAGQVLDATGKVADPHAALRYLAEMFPGNMKY